jgi:hypothetical protein
MSLHGKYTVTEVQTDPPVMIPRGASSFFVRMKGYAVRVKYKVPIPAIVQVGTKTAYRVGSPRVSQKQITKGNVPVYLAMWDILYAIEGDIYSDDILKDIVSSGAPANYI